MDLMRSIVQIVITLGIFNVWLLRFGKATAFRGGNASSLKEEFAIYGFPYGFMLAIGALKLSLAAALLIGLFYPAATRPAAIGMAVLMLGAVSMHIKVKDPPMKSLPAAAMLAMSLFVALA